MCSNTASLYDDVLELLESSEGTNEGLLSYLDLDLDLLDNGAQSPLTVTVSDDDEHTDCDCDCDCISANEEPHLTINMIPMPGFFKKKSQLAQPQGQRQQRQVPVVPDPSLLAPAAAAT